MPKKLQISADTIRFYEKKGLIQPIFRANNQYRYYGDDSLKKLMFIKHCRALEMSLKEIRSLLELEQSPQQNCSVVNEMIDQNIENINNRINDLNNFKQHLIQLRNSCNAPTTVDHCQILKQLESTDI